MIAFARFEIRRTLRDSRFMLFLVAMPALLYLLLAGFTHSGRQDGLPAPAAFMVAMMCYAAIGSACYAIGPPLAAERARGWIRQLQIMPLAGTSWLAVKLIQGALLILPGITVVAATAAITQSPDLTPARWAALAAVLLAGSLPFTVLGLVIGQALDGQSANSATLFTVLGLSFAGGLLIPDTQLPQPSGTPPPCSPPASSPTWRAPPQPATAPAPPQSACSPPGPSPPPAPPWPCAAATAAHEQRSRP